MSFPLNNRMRLVVLGFCILLLQLSVVAQQHVNLERGLNAHSYLSGDFDHVNLYNGNLTLTIPIGQSYKVGGGLEYSFTLTYNSNAWYFKTENQPNEGERTRAEVNPKSNAGMGWQLSLGALYPPNTPGYNDDFNRPLYVAPDGSEHLFDTELYPGRFQTGMRFTNDGTFLRLRTEGGVRKIEFPNGQVHTFGANNLLSRIEDRFGNVVDVDTSSSVQWLVNEKCNTCAPNTRQQKITFSGGRVDQVQLDAFTGDAVYKFNYTQAAIKRHNKDNWVRTNNYIDVWRLVSLELPANAGFYDFEYNTGEMVPSGLITSATLPTRGHYKWDYQTYTRPVNVLNPTPVCQPYCPDETSPISSSDGILYKKIFKKPNDANPIGQFDYSLGDSIPTTVDPRGWTSVTVKSPEGDETVNYFNVSFDAEGYNTWEFGLPYSPKDTANSQEGNLYLSQEIYKGTVANGTKLRSVYVQYAGDPKTGFHDRANYRITAHRTIYEDGLSADTYFKNWSGLGKFQIEQTAGSFAHGNNRTSTTDYSSTMPGVGAAWILNRFTNQAVDESSMSSKVSFCFDANTGFMEAKRIHKGGGTVPQDIFIDYGADGNGNVTSERFFGGDKTANAGSNSDACVVPSGSPEYEKSYTYSFGSLATSKIVGQQFFTTNNTINQRTGLISASTDSAEVVTAFDYDELGRVKKVDSFADEDTFYTYSPAAGSTLAQVTIERKSSETDNTPLAVGSITFDNFGRSTKSSELVPTGPTTSVMSVKETKYNAMGWVISTSEYGDTTKTTQYVNYDPFGRAGKIISPDGFDTIVDYTGVSRIKRTVKIGTSRDAAGNITKSPASAYEFYDRQGRLQSVQEDSGINNAPSITSYKYDVGNRLKSVSMSTATPPPPPLNVALAGNGGVASASSSYPGWGSAGGANNGDRTGRTWGYPDGGWLDGTQGEYSADWLQVTFNGNKTINEIDVVTLQDDPAFAVEPTLTQTFSTATDVGKGITAFDVQYWDGVRWITVPGGSVSDNNKVWRKFQFPAVSTSKIRVAVHDSVRWFSRLNDHARIVEVEAYDTNHLNVALNTNGGVASASSSFPGWGSVGGANNGDRTGRTWGYPDGGWLDGTQGEYSADWLQVTFSGNKTINEIDVVTLQDNPAVAVEPTLTQTFSTATDIGKGITAFDVQYWDGVRWITVPGGSVYGNNKVWRKFQFPAVSTSKIRVAVHDSVRWFSRLNDHARIVEVEAYEVPSDPQGGITQTRTFNYDNRGFLFSETHPEINGAVTYGQYDTMGQLGNKVEGGKTLLYNYDSTGRLVNIKEQSTNRLLKEFAYYDTNGTGGNYRLGKLKKAIRHNWVRNPFSSDPNSPELDVRISEENTYAGREGRLDSRITRMNEENPAHYKFNQTFQYDELGNLNNQSYPECQNTTCVQSGVATPRTVKYDYTNGYLTKVWRPSGGVNYASNISYHLNRTVNTVQHGNGVTDTYARDASTNMARPHNITFTKGATQLWSTGQYEYDGIGNVVKMGSDWFIYDRVNRVKEGTAGIAYNNIQRKQAYTYDVMGNVLTITTTDHEGTHPVYSNNVVPQTNRLPYYYDAAGNFLGVTAPNLYEYDPLNMMKKLPGKTYLYGPNDERMWVVDKQYNDLGPAPSPTPTIIQTVTLRGLGNEMLREYTIYGGDAVNSWAWTKDYVYKGSTLLSSETPSGKFDYHVDHLGTPRIVTASNGNQTAGYAQYLYPYGAEAQTFYDERLKFTGHERDLNIGQGHALDYMHARYYAFNNGRFINVDPGRDFDPKQPQSWNRYSYLRGNPVNGTDPTGKFFVQAVGGILLQAFQQVGGIPNPGPTASNVFNVNPSEVYLCKRRTEFEGALEVMNKVSYHYWLKTSEKEVGLGKLGGGIPGREVPDDYTLETSLNDHTGQAVKPGSTCVLVKEADAAIVNRELELGKPMGKWSPVNNCYTVVNQILWKATGGPAKWEKHQKTLVFDRPL